MAEFRTMIPNRPINDAVEPMPSRFQNRLADARNTSLDRDARMEAFANRLFSGTTYALWRGSEAITERAAQGLTLDAGSGRGGWASVIARNGERESVDIAPRGDEEVTWVADLQDMPQVPTARYDSVVCHQVLEHVPHPHQAIAELLRVMKPGGLAAISVPHLSRLHELPHDYTRFTPNGLKLALEDAGFEVIELNHFGGLACFIHHQLATIGSAIFNVLPFGGKVFSVLNAPFSYLAQGFDARTDRKGLLANGVIALARKPDRG
ncbi:MAG: class I SAM-dependent methyltransferase [Erythrobacter sp.]